MTELEILKGIFGLKGGAALFEKFGSLYAVAKLTDEQLTDDWGVRPYKLKAFRSALALAAKPSMLREERPQLTSSEAVAERLTALIGGREVEECVVIYLNRRNEIIEEVNLFTGGIDQVVMDVRVILRRALELSASAFIVSHNHPSGKAAPSRTDIEVTKNLFASSKLMGIAMLDHVIVTSDPTHYYSFADEGIL